MAKYKSKSHSNRTILNLAIVAMLALGAVAGVTAIQNPKALGLVGAWDCSKYTFNVSQQGQVTVLNSSSRAEKAQKADVFINNTKVVTLDVPALPAYGVTPTVIGTVTVPAGAFSWKVDGSLDCLNSGQYQAPIDCNYSVIKAQ